MKIIVMLLIAILPAVTQTSNPLTRQIKRDEGLRRRPYQDIMNRLVVGYGHKLGAHCGDSSAKVDGNRTKAFFIRTSTQPAPALLPEIVEAEYLGTLGEEDRKSTRLNSSHAN